MDIDRGVYIAAHYPPYFHSNHANDERISPFDTSAKPQDPSYWKHISLSQRQRYYALVEQSLNQALDETKDLEPEVALLFAHYQADYHVRQHQLARRGVLTLCRDSDDLQQLRKWQWRMSDIDSLQSSTLEEIEPLRSRQWGWPNDKNLEMVHQHLMWKRSSRARLKRVREVRAQWAVIMEERRRQREMLLLKQGATLTVRLFCRGELWDIRELQTVHTIPSPRMPAGRITRSMGS